MFDTYGEDYFTVRGFVEGGWKSIQNAEGDLNKEGPLFHVSVQEFRDEIYSQLNANDTVIFPFLVDEKSTNQEFALPAAESELFKLAANIRKEKKSKTGLVVVGKFQNVAEAKKLGDHFDGSVFVEMSKFEQVEGVAAASEFAAKLIFNAITTGSCVQNGRVFRNVMINLGVSNNKLFFRSIGIVQKLIGVSEEVARTSLLKAIYGVENLTDVSNASPR
eukprot:TRINITY_DN2059_c0_g2_i1.p3 TRINITY_DN2059_c0_g2~~TRINITY_DN2059_c0_g2_i1.p3  ORF type:complete len:219 (-),score=88.94 TRINITY_DN2059_c0_g2_i1:1123-1779(-)